MTGQEPLPTGWTWTTLAELCEINPKHSGEHADTLPVSFVPMAAVDDQVGAITVAENRPYGEVRKGYTHFADGDVLFAKITPCMENGKAAVARGLTNGIGCGTTEFFVLRSRGAVLPEYVHRFVRQESYRRAARRTMQSGVGQARVPKDFIGNTLIPVPPLAEQHRIVTKLDELLASSRAARTALDAIPALLERYRRAVLAAAFRDLLDGRYASYSLESLIPSGRTITYGIVQTGTPTPDGVPTVRCGDIKRFSVTVDALKRVAPNIETQYPRTRLRGGEVLLAIRGSVGEVAVAPQALTGANVSREVAVIPAREDVEPEYLMYLLASPVVAATISGQVKGVAQSGINIGDLRRIEVPLPSRERQAGVVQAIQDALASIDRLADRVGSSRSNLEVLEQATLAKAFHGELVAQDPAEEPAPTLLARLRASDTSPASARRPRRAPTHA